MAHIWVLDFAVTTKSSTSAGHKIEFSPRKLAGRTRHQIAAVLLPVEAAAATRLLSSSAPQRPLLL